MPALCCRFTVTCVCRTQACSNRVNSTDPDLQCIRCQYSFNSSKPFCDNCPINGDCDQWYPWEHAHAQGSAVIGLSLCVTTCPSPPLMPAIPRLHTRWAVPKAGYWTSHPRAANMHRCPYDGACVQEGRQSNLKLWTQARRLGDFNESELTQYNDLQCSPGYTSNVCGR